jgi:hypothetical protein
VTFVGHVHHQGQVGHRQQPGAQTQNEHCPGQERAVPRRSARHDQQQAGGGHADADGDGRLVPDAVDQHRPQGERDQRGDAGDAGEARGLTGRHLEESRRFIERSLASSVILGSSFRWLFALLP